MIVGHVNLAKGFRGGERQTELLIRELARRGMTQVLIVRRNSELGARLNEVPGLTIRQIGKPYVFGVGAARGCDLMHAHEAKAGQYAYWVKRLLGIPYVITRRVPDVPSNNFFTRAVYRNARVIVALSRAIKSAMLTHNPQLDVRIIPSMSAQLPVNDTKVAELRERFAGKFLVGHVGALVNYHKGQQYLIEAARMLSARYADMHFIFLGSGRDEAWFRELASGLANVTFEGFVDNVGDYLRCFDLFVFPSLHEGLGSILLDVMQAEVPVIAADVDGIPDIVESGECGLLVPPKDVSAIMVAIESLHNNSELRMKFIENGKSKVRDYMPEFLAERVSREIYWI